MGDNGCRKDSEGESCTGNKTRRERYVEKARALLGDARLLAFLRQCRTACDSTACKLINDELDQGKSLDDVFYTGSDFGYQLTARKAGPNDFSVEFGLVAGQEEGDGGRWSVAFGEDDNVDSIELVSEWIA